MMLRVAVRAQCEQIIRCVVTSHGDVIEVMNIKSNNHPTSRVAALVTRLVENTLPNIEAERLASHLSPAA